MSTSYKYREFLGRIKDRGLGNRTNIAESLVVFNHVMSMLPWVHIENEMEIVADGNALRFVGRVTQALYVQVSVCDGEAIIMLEGADVAIDGSFTNPAKLFEETVSTDPMDIIGAMSKLLMQYTHVVECPPKQLFTTWRVSHTLGIDDDLSAKNVTVHQGREIWLSPSKQTFYVMANNGGFWVHPKGVDAVYKAIERLWIGQIAGASGESRALPPE